MGYAKDSVIEIKNVTKTFKNIKAVDNLNVEIFPGEYVALLGPNGAGKTTLIEMIEGIQFPDSGSIRFFGKTWKNNEQELHKVIGLSLQETRFIDKLTVEETLDLFASFYNLEKDRTKEVLGKVNLLFKRKDYVVNLSGGQRQRLALGVAILNKPKILLLDEPTTGLDPTARREIWDILTDLKENEGTSMILTTHYMEEAEYLCERILIMDKGNIIASGTLNELINQNTEGGIINFTLSQNVEIEFIAAIQGLKKILWTVEKTKGTLVVNNIAEVLPEFLHLIANQKIKILELESKKITLEDLFIQMTGRTLSEK